MLLTDGSIETPAIIMIWFIALVALVIFMSISEKLWGNPLSFIGAGFLAFCVALLGGVVQTALGLH